MCSAYGIGRAEKGDDEEDEDDEDDEDDKVEAPMEFDSYCMDGLVDQPWRQQRQRLLILEHACCSLEGIQAGQGGQPRCLPRHP